MLYWIQRADFTSEEYEASGAPEIQRAFRSRAWSGELEFESRRNDSGEESCSPGLGIVAGDGRLLHLCPAATDMLVHYHYTERRKILGLLSTSRPRVVTVNKDLARADQLITTFVHSDHEALMRELES